MILEEPQLSIKPVSARVTEISLREDGILRMDMLPVDEITIADQKEILQKVHTLGGRKAFCNLVVFKHYIQVDEGARKFCASEVANIFTLADAFVVNSIALKLLASFYMQVNKPIRPTRIFTKEDEAISWLRTFL